MHWLMFEIQSTCATFTLSPSLFWKEETASFPCSSTSLCSGQLKIIRWFSPFRLLALPASLWHKFGCTVTVLVRTVILQTWVHSQIGCTVYIITVATPSDSFHCKIGTRLASTTSGVVGRVCIVGRPIFRVVVPVSLVERSLNLPPLL